MESPRERAARCLPSGAAWIVVHVTSGETTAPMEGARPGLLGRGRRVEEARQRINATAHASAATILAAVSAWLSARGIAHTTVARWGQPEREITRLTADLLPPRPPLKPPR